MEALDFLGLIDHCRYYKIGQLRGPETSSFLMVSFYRGT